MMMELNLCQVNQVNKVESAPRSDHENFDYQRINGFCEENLKLVENLMLLEQSTSCKMEMMMMSRVSMKLYVKN
jgi:hypothetical protein